ncbi:MAG: hypothetical protein K2I40_08105, partial [Bifidobacterium castoris]|nr:hypothetical protein [Bifidobacterium castoris]
RASNMNKPSFHVMAIISMMSHGLVTMHALSCRYIVDISVRGRLPVRAAPILRNGTPMAAATAVFRSLPPAPPLIAATVAYVGALTRTPPLTASITAIFGYTHP